MHPYTTSKRLIAGILLVSHGLMSCSNFDVNKQEFEDSTTKLALRASSDTDPTVSSSKEGEEAALPTLSKVSNENTISSETEKNAILDTRAAEKEILESAPADIPEG